MDTLVLSLIFLGVIGLFATWLFWTLRTERLRTLALREHARAAAMASRRATRAARRESVAPADRLPVVRAGSFCRVPGTYARNTRGATMVCSSERKGRPRWRHAEKLRHAS